MATKLPCQTELPDKRAKKRYQDEIENCEDGQLFVQTGLVAEERSKILKLKKQAK